MLLTHEGSYAQGPLGGLDLVQVIRASLAHALSGTMTAARKRPLIIRPAGGTPCCLFLRLEIPLCKILHSVGQPLRQVRIFVNHMVALEAGL